MFGSYEEIVFVRRTSHQLAIFPVRIGKVVNLIVVGDDDVIDFFIFSSVCLQLFPSEFCTGCHRGEGGGAFRFFFLHIFVFPKMIIFAQIFAIFCIAFFPRFLPFFVVCLNISQFDLFFFVFAFFLIFPSFSFRFQFY